VRTRELAEARGHLSEALEQQTATSEVLRIISSSPGELALVFEAMLANAVRLCEARFGMLFLHERGALRIVATHNVPPEVHEARRSFQPHPDGTLGKVLRTKRTVHVDLASTPAYAERHPATVEAVELGGIRTNVAVPMLKDEEVVGVIVVHRQEVRPFSDKQVALLTSFADQAVIAIENTRLLNELRESLENQTASADILRAIASSPAKAERALDVIAETTARRFVVSNVNIRLLDGNTLRYVGSTGPTAEHMQALFPEGPPNANTTSGKAILERRQTYLRGDDVPVLARAAGIVSSVATPLIREGQAIGVLMVLRSDPRPFTDTDLAQLSNFADQAVIAIENTRLLNEPPVGGHSCHRGMLPHFHRAVRVNDSE
jgi:GAF domain-containing protein